MNSNDQRGSGKIPTAIPWILSSVLLIAVVVLLFKHSDAGSGGLASKDEEIRQLRNELAALKGEGSGQSGKPAPGVQGPKSFAVSTALIAGATNALDLAAAYVEAAASQSNSNKLSDELRSVFKKTGEAAAEGQTGAFVSLFKATRKPELVPFAVEGLGVAAVRGHDQSAALLLDAGNFGISKIAAVPGLKYMAEATNAQAIAVLAAMARDQTLQAGWKAVALALVKPAHHGNAQAIEALSVLALSKDPDVQEIVRKALLDQGPIVKEAPVQPPPSVTEPAQPAAPVKEVAKPEVAPEPELPK